MEQGAVDQRSRIGVVFWVSAAIALAFILWGVIAPVSFGVVTQAMFDWVVSNLGWFYLLAGTFFLIFVLLRRLQPGAHHKAGRLQTVSPTA
jgi:glycine betaine transporter